jgi:hypothetical protein
MRVMQRRHDLLDGDEPMDDTELDAEAEEVEV